MNEIRLEEYTAPKKEEVHADVGEQESEGEIDSECP